MALSAADKARRIKELAVASIVVSEMLLAGSLRNALGEIVTAPIGEDAEEVRRSIQMQAMILSDAEAMIIGERGALAV